MYSRRALACVACLQFAALTGCANTCLKAYPGPKRPVSELAIIKGDWSYYVYGGGHVLIKAVDGRTEGAGEGRVRLFKKAEVLPGRHSVTAVIHEEESWLLVDVRRRTLPRTVSFDAEAGRTYVVTGRIDDPNLWVWVVDAETETVVGGHSPPD